MKIDTQILGVTAGISSGSAQGSGNTGDTSFAEQLSKVIQQAIEEVTTTETDIGSLEQKDSMGMAMNNADTQIKIKSAKIAELTQKQAYETLDSLLAVLENFEGALGNPAVSLKEMDPLVKRMQAKADDLENMLPGMDKDLQALSQQVLSQARIESIKFERGDYIG